MTTTSLPADFHPDFIIVGGGTAGCVVASRLSSYLPSHSVLLIEAGPSDLGNASISNLAEWQSLLGGPLDYDYRTTPQPHANSHIRHSRARVLGGCSSHNTLISFRPLASDLASWPAGWDLASMSRHFDALRTTIVPLAPQHRNPLAQAWLASAEAALGVRTVADFGREPALGNAAGFFSVAYDAATNTRSSASAAYLHPILTGREPRPNLVVLTHARVERLNLAGGRGASVTLRLREGRAVVRARREIVLCAGAIDTPRLLLLSGIGARAPLARLGIALQHALPGVGANLRDHAETLVMYALRAPPPAATAMHSDVGLFLGGDARVMLHTLQLPFGEHAARLGYAAPAHAFCMTPNVPRPRSRGRLYLTSADPDVPPALDFAYLSDAADEDAAVLVAGIRAARRIAKEPPFSEYVLEEVAPGEELQSDAELKEYARRVAHTVYHPAGTTKMGDGEDAVVDAQLRLRGVDGVRIADAGVFPTMISVNPIVTVLAIGERCAELVAEAHGWRREERAKL